jgi:hypothetical protein
MEWSEEFGVVGRVGLQTEDGSMVSDGEVAFVCLFVSYRVVFSNMMSDLSIQTVYIYMYIQWTLDLRTRFVPEGWS